MGRMPPVCVQREALACRSAHWRSQGFFQGLGVFLCSPTLDPLLLCLLPSSTVLLVIRLISEVWFLLCIPVNSGMVT